MTTHDTRTGSETAIPADVMKAARGAHADFARSSVTDNLTVIIARAIMADRERRIPSPQAEVRGDLYDAEAFMADGGDTPMTAAENVLAWLLVEKIGVPDDVSYSPNQAQEIIVRRLDLGRELEEIGAMLAEGQGDDEGYPIMPEFVKGMTTYAKVEACLHLLERRRDALHPSPQPRAVTPTPGASHD